MSKYTTEVRYIVEVMNGKTESQDRPSINEMVNAVSSTIIGDYPIFDEAYRQTLNNKIIKHFYTQEIGFETVALWRFKLNVKMNEIMPYYNQLYESELLTFDPLLDFNYTKDGNTHTTTQKDSRSFGTAHEQGEKTEKEQSDESINRNTDGNSVSETDNNAITTNVAHNEQNNESNNASVTTSSNENSQNGLTENNGMSAGSTESKNEYSDTPQGSLQNLESETYLTNGSVDKNTTVQNDSHLAKDESESAGNSNTVNSGNSKDNNENDSVETNASNGKEKQEINNNENETKVTTGNANNETSHTKDNSNNSNEHSDITDMTGYIEHLRGKRSLTSYSKLLLEFRDTFLNIDMMIIRDLQELFMGVW